MDNASGESTFQGNEIAIIGMAGRFPMAHNLETFWRNLAAGMEGITFFSPEELRSAGVSPSLLDDLRYVRANGMLDDIDLFDAAFFGYSPREAEIIDPQQRIFLECAWEALEDAGYDPLTYQDLIGVYAGLNMNTYYPYVLFQMLLHPDLEASIDRFQLMLANDKDYLTTRVSYKLNLRGPSIAVQTACSTSLVAVHLACQSLLSGECDIALAGGVSVHAMQRSGYYYQEGGIASSDGHCRTFDASAQGTLNGNGVGIVVLKRLTEALNDGDCIHAIIKGTACNNDGALKVGYTAPSVQGQADVIAEALSMAALSPETISYIEAHGTATPLGDPIEVTALTRAFSAYTTKKQFCAIGSVKTNIGHLGVAAGIAGLLKTIFALKYQMLPPSLHFEKPNPQIDFASSPFYVNTALTPWRREHGEEPLRAGVSSFGIGGTNAHVIVEEAPQRELIPGSERSWYLLVLSGKTENALARRNTLLAAYLRHHPEANLADIAYTLQVGRSRMSYRQVLVCRNTDEAIQVLEGSDPARLFNVQEKATSRPVAMVFPGQGSQYVRMGQDLYRTEPVFRAEVDRCAVLLQPQMKLDIRTLLYPDPTKINGDEAATEQLRQTWLTQPVLFVIEYALACLWESWGIHPQAMIGHSIGEYVAACLAGVFTLEEALRLVAVRGRLMQQVAPGSMLAVPLARAEVELSLAALPLEVASLLSIAAVNSPVQTVIAGPVEAIDALDRYLQSQDIDAHRLRTSYAFHSAMVEPILAAFGTQMRTISLRAPQLRYVSNVTGTWITDALATDPEYWVRHLRQEVRFADGMATLLEEPDLVLLEVGPGSTLSFFTHQIASERLVVSSLPRQAEESSVSHILTSFGRLWMVGVTVDWRGMYTYEQRLRIPLPTYPFERQRYWVEPSGPGTSLSVARKVHMQRREVQDWFYVPFWKQSVLSQPFDAGVRSQHATCWLVFLDSVGLGMRIVQRLRAQGYEVVAVTACSRYERVAPGAFTINPWSREDHSRLFSQWYATVNGSGKILHLWNMDQITGSLPEDKTFLLTFSSMLYLAQAIGEYSRAEALEINVVSDQLHDVTGMEQIVPEQALLPGLCKVIPQEYPYVACHSIDIHWEKSDERRQERLAEQIIAECLSSVRAPVVAYRGTHRWTQGLEARPLPALDAVNLRLRQKGVYLITGGLGGIGMILAEQLAVVVGARLILVGRTPIPERDAWEQWIQEHGEQDDISRKIGKIKEMEALGAEVLAVSVDVNDYRKMQALVEQIYTRFGALHGIIHAAGIAGGRLLQLAHLEEAYDVLAPKVMGTRVLEYIIQNRPVDFFVLCSSLSSLRGGTGQADYSAANAFLDAFAYYHTTRRGVPTIAINWDVWGEVGMAINTPLPSDLQEHRQRNLRNAITPLEGWEAFDRILECGLPQVVVSTVELQIANEVSDRVSTSTSSEVLHKELPEEHWERSVSSLHLRPELVTEYVAPRNELEKELADLWGRVLGVAEVGIFDNFFDLGGHSLLATQVVSRLRKELHVELRLRQMLEKPTVAELASMIKAGHLIQETPDVVSQMTDVRRAEEYAHTLKTYPIAFAQQRLWFLDRLEPGNTRYTLCMAAYVKRDANVRVLERSLYEVVKRHESLRTTFKMEGGEPFQVIHPEANGALPLIDLQPLTEADRLTQALRLIDEEARHVFDLVAGPLFCVNLLHLEPQKYAIIFCVHHIILDTWSLNILLHELSVLYEAFLQEKVSTLPPLPLQYGEYAVWQRNWLQGTVLQTHLDYWQKQLHGAQPAEIPTVYSYPEVRNHQGASYAFTVPGDLALALASLSRQQETSLFMTLLAAFQAFLYRSTEQEDIVVGTDIANRTHVETESLIGFFVNILALRTHVKGTLTFRHLLRQVREMVLEAYTYQHLPFSLLIEHLRLERRLHETPLIRVLLVLQNVPRAAQETAEALFELIPGEATNARFDLALLLSEHQEGISGTVVYSTELFEEHTVANMMSRFSIFLRSIVDKPDITIDLLDMYTEIDKQEQEQRKHTRRSTHLRHLKGAKGKAIDIV